jgi:Protein of unknown function (DUF2950)
MVVLVDSTEEDFMGVAKPGTHIAGFGGARMSNLLQDRNIQTVRIVAVMTLLALIIPMTSCRKAEGAATKEERKTFASPEEAGAALFKATKSGDQNLLLEVIGPGGKEVLFSGDAAVDQTAMKDFAAAYELMHRWGKIEAGGQMLYIGADNFPFPIPLERNSSGQWYFDTAEGADEIQARRIGRDELVAIAALGALANAQQQYFSQKRAGQTQEYARKFVSDEGQHDGLYWPASNGEAQSPLAQMGDFAMGAGYTDKAGTPRPFNGYKFRILTKQGLSAKGGAKNYIVNGKMTGGFAIIAYPVEYRTSGIMTFLIGPDGVVYQKDLGVETSELAQGVTEYNPGAGWEPASQE